MSILIVLFQVVQCQEGVLRIGLECTGLGDIFVTSFVVISPWHCPDLAAGASHREFAVMLVKQS